MITPDEATIKDVTWKSSNESVAVVDESGEIFAVGTGKCKVTATHRMVTILQEHAGYM